MSLWTCPGCGDDLPAALEHVHPRVCRVPTRPESAIPEPPAAEPDWYLEQVATRDAAVDALHSERERLRERIDKAAAARDRIEAEHKLERKRREEAERAATKATERLHRTELALTEFRKRCAELEDQLRRKRGENGKHGTYPLSEDAQRELAKLMRPGPGAGV